MELPNCQIKGYRRRKALLERGVQLKDENCKNIYQNLVYVNLVYCDPPMSDNEVNTIYNMVCYHPLIFKATIWKTKN